MKEIVKKNGKQITKESMANIDSYIGSILVEIIEQQKSFEGRITEDTLMMGYDFFARNGKK